MFKIILLLLLYSLSGFSQNLNSGSYLFNNNNLKLSINNKGNIANFNNSNGSGAYYDGKIILYSSGFMLAGKSNGVLWGNGQAAHSLVNNYLPGIVNSDADDPKNVVYVVKASDPAFGSSWIQYKDAVSLGADFYDGNNDGIYNPVDLNFNGKWDLTEDKPDILGDVTAWSVFNDGVPANLRTRFPDVPPQGIEIQQTAFSYDGNSGYKGNVIYFRYRITNKGTKVSIMDSVYFSIWAEPDIGNYSDDLVGCDTLLNAGFCYSNTSDSQYGENPPALLFGLLQGPVSYIPGVTFTDNNNNGIFDEGIDTPLENAYSNRGSLLGVKEIKGARNLPMTSFIQYRLSDPVLGDPNTELELYNYQRGHNKLGEDYDPCDRTMGVIEGKMYCNSINYRFWYSGDPVNHYGWIDNRHEDKRTSVNTGPFKLELNKPVEIIAAYSPGRAYTPLYSVTAAKRNYFEAYINYTNNFPTAYVDNTPGITPELFYLNQNYPNPFNPSTTISYTLTASANVNVSLYNSLGQELRVLDSGFKTAGLYELKLNAGDLCSGTYFYRLVVTTPDGRTNYSSTHKLMLIK